MKSLLYALLLQTAIFAQPVLLSRSTAIVIDGREPIAVRKAANDLATDLEKVLGAKPRVVESIGLALGPAIIVSCDYAIG